jgi:hypothetical protein
LHGGASTGPTSAEGLERFRRAVTKHGRRSAAAVAERKRRAAELRHARRMLALLMKSPDELTPDDLAALRGVGP